MTKITISDQPKNTPTNNGLVFRLLVVAAIFHLALTAMLYFMGQAQLLPGLLDSRGIGSFASDATEYIPEINQFIEIFENDGLVAWLQAPFTGYVHTKLVSLSFILLGPLFGFSILSAELYNLSLYLMILYLIYALGGEVFNRRAGLMAAAMIGLWPSFLLHTTQLLKDPLFIAGFLALMVINTRWFTRQHSPVSALAHTMVAVGLVNILGLVRPVWPLMLMGVIVVAAFGFFIKILLERSIMLWNLVGVICLIGATVFITRSQITDITPSVAAPPPLPAEATGDPQAEQNSSQNADSQDMPPDDSASIAGNEQSDHLPVYAAQRPYHFWDSIVLFSDALSQKIGVLRRGFVLDYAAAGSTIDTDYQIEDSRDLIGYLPRAMAIGFFAPFPNMWFERGEKLGLSSRLLSGAETLTIYAVSILAVVGVWPVRRRISVWQLVGVLVLGLTSLGLVVVVVGALYRMRYAYWMLLIVLGAGGLDHLIPHRRLPADSGLS